MTKRWTAYKLKIKDIEDGDYSDDGFVKYNDIEVKRVRVLGSIVSKFVSEDGKYGFYVIDDATGTIRIRSFEDTLYLIERASVGDIIDVIGRLRKYKGELYVIPESVQKIEDPNWIMLRKLELKKQDKEFGADSGTEPKSEDSNEQTQPKPSASNEKPQPETSNEKPEPESKTEENPEEEKSDDDQNSDITEVVEEVIDENAEVTSKDNSKKQETSESPKGKIVRLIKELSGDGGVEIDALIKKSALEKNVAENILNDMMNEGEIFEPRAGKVKLLE